MEDKYLISFYVHFSINVLIYPMKSFIWEFSVIFDAVFV